MKTSRSKYFLSCLIMLVSCYLQAQTNSDTNQNQALIMVIGNSVQNNNSNDFINTNPYPQSNIPPPIQQQSSSNKNTIEPTLENGFHARLEMGSSQSIDKMSSAPYFPSDGNMVKVKKTGLSYSEFKFNFKKRFKARMPKRSKKYRPHRCGRF